ISTHLSCCDTLAEAHGEADALEAYGATSSIALVPALALGAGLVGTPELIIERIERYCDIGIELLMLHFHPMLAGLQTLIDRLIPKAPRAATAPPGVRRGASWGRRFLLFSIAPPPVSGPFQSPARPVVE